MPVKRTRMADVAKMAGVSQTTVSFVLNGIEAGLPECTKRRVVEAARALNYSPNAAARRLASRNSRAIGFALYDIAYLADYMSSTAAVISSVYQAAELQGHQLIIYTTHEHREGGEGLQTYFAAPIRSREVDGAVVWDGHIDSEYLTNSYYDGMPIVTIDRQVGEVPCVVPDYEAGIEEMVRELLERGHERFALLYTGTYYRDLQIRASFDQAMERMGIPNSHITIKEGKLYPGWEDQRVKAQLDEILAQPNPPTALICGASKTGLCVQVDLASRGIRVPEEMAIGCCAQVSADDHPLIAMTALDTHLDIMCRKAVDLVIRMIKGEDLAGTRVVIRPDLMIRRTI